MLKRRFCEARDIRALRLKRDISDSNAHWNLKLQIMKTTLTLDAEAIESFSHTIDAATAAPPAVWLGH